MPFNRPYSYGRMRAIRSSVRSNPSFWRNRLNRFPYPRPRWGVRGRWQGRMRQRWLSKPEYKYKVIEENTAGGSPFDLFTAMANTTQNTQIVTLLNGVAQGDDYEARQGRMVRWTGLYMKLMVQLEPVGFWQTRLPATGIPNKLRPNDVRVVCNHFILLDRTPNGAAPSHAMFSRFDLTTVGPLDFRNPTVPPSRYQILWRRTYSLLPSTNYTATLHTQAVADSSNPAILFPIAQRMPQSNKYMKMGRKLWITTHYTGNGATTTNMGSNAIWHCFVHRMYYNTQTVNPDDAQLFSYNIRINGNIRLRFVDV